MTNIMSKFPINSSHLKSQKVREGESSNVVSPLKLVAFNTMMKLKVNFTKTNRTWKFKVVVFIYNT